MLRACCLALACAAGCALRAPAPIDVGALVAARGPIEAHRDLEIRATNDPRDVASRLALAELDEQIGRPSEAIDALEAVQALGGPAGTRWHAADRLRLARLIAARGRSRLARGAGSALADLERARQLGASVRDDALDQAKAAQALTELRHSDAEVRQVGRQALAALAEAQRGAAFASDDLDAWLGARAGALPAQRGVFGAWLWVHGARRAGWDELSAWHAAAPAPRAPVLQTAWLVAARWWLPFDQPVPAGDDLVGPWRCAFTPCAPHEVVGDDVAERALLRAPLAPLVRHSADAAGLAVITLRSALRGELAWGPALAARVDLAMFANPAELATLPRYAQPLFAQLAGHAATAGEGATPDERLLVAAARLLAGDTAAVAQLGDGEDAEALRRIATPGAPFTGDALAEAVARHASLMVPAEAQIAALRAIVIAYRRDPLIAERLARDAVARAADAAAMHAILGALFDALADPARARAAWQAAVDASAEPAFLRGLAEAEAREGDGDAALISATTAAAASGDPAVVWTSVASALVGSGRYVQALEAARSAIDLSGPDTLVEALTAASMASRALGRDEQADTLEQRRSHLPPGQATSEHDPTDPRAQLAAYRRSPDAAGLARLWTSARWNPRDVPTRAALLAALPTDDPRHGILIGELVDLAGDRDPAIRRAAIAALREASRPAPSAAGSAAGRTGGR